MCAPVVPLLGLAVSAIGTGFGIVQSQQQAAAQAEQARQSQEMANQQAAQQRLARNQQLQMQYDQAAKDLTYQRQQQINSHIGQVKSQQAAYLAYNEQLINNERALQRGTESEQLKLKEARDAAAFKSQEIYAKSIGNQGRVLASGASGQSIGLLAMDAERQSGLQEAEQNASVRSAETSAGFALDSLASDFNSQNTQALNNVPDPVQAPSFAPNPIGVTVGIPDYNWG